MHDLLNTLRYELRSLQRTPGFTAVTILTLALGIGANTAIFSVVDAALLRPLPYREPDRLFTLGQARSALVAEPHVSYPDYEYWAANSKTFQSFAGYATDSFVLSAGGEPKTTRGAQVTPNFFATLGVAPVMGRDFTASDLNVERPVAAIVTHGFWRSELQGDPQVIGRLINLNGAPVRIIGVLPRQFEFAPAGAPVWVPLHVGKDGMSMRLVRWLNVIARLAPGQSEAQGLAEMRTFTAQLAAAFPKEDAGIQIRMGSLRERVVGKIRPLLLVLLGSVGFVLLIACANVANLLLTRTVGRRKEFAVRTALGASGSELMAQALMGSLLLASLGAIAGLLGAHWGISILIGALPDWQVRSMPYLQNVGINWSAVLFLCAITILTALLFGIAPGVAGVQMPPEAVLREESRGGTSRTHARLRSTIVVVEIAISVVLLAGAGLMVRSLHTLVTQNPGFDSGHVLYFSISLPETTYRQQMTYPFANPSARQFEHRFRQKLNELPGVEAVGAASAAPATNQFNMIRFAIEGRPKPPGHDDDSYVLVVAGDYFSALKIPLISGRLFSPADSPDSPPVVAVSQTFARTYFGNESPVGKRIRFTFDAREPYMAIVGVVGDTTQTDLAAPPRSFVYCPSDQVDTSSLSYLVRTSGEPATLVSGVRAKLKEIDAQLPLTDPQPLDSLLAKSPSVFLRRYPSYLIGSFAGLALILAVVGLYGLISYSIAQRTREFGIRMALGGRRTDIWKMVLSQGLSSALIGAAIGVTVGLACAPLISNQLYGVKPYDWITFAGASLLLVTVAGLACIVPAWRATAIDPIQALRDE